MTAPASDTARVIAPPPLLFAGAFAAAMAVGHALGLPGLGLGVAVRAALAAGLLAAGAALLLAAIGGFRRAGTAPEPWRPSTAVVATGVYARTRNPMYLGMTLAYLALTCAVDALAPLVALPALIAVVQLGVIAREERYLERKFGEAYRRYRASVPRWL